MASTRDPTAASSSSEATDTENSCTERYDCEKSPSISNSCRRRGGGGSDVLRGNNGESIISRSGSETDLRRFGDPPGDDYDKSLADFQKSAADLQFFDPRNDDDSLLRMNRHRNDRFILDDTQQQLRGGKRTFQRPASVKSAGSYEIRDSCPLRRGFESDLNTAQHEHYMIPTHEPNNRLNDKRTLSLFNPDFLPNFNDMLMYVGCSSPAARERDDFYQCNVEDTTWNMTAVPSIVVDPTSQRFDNNAVNTVRQEGPCDFSRNLEASYASLRLNDRPSHHQLRDQDCENIYAPVGLQAFQSQGRIDYNC